MSSAPPVDFTHTANARVIGYLSSRRPDSTRSLAPEEADLWALGAHPDLIEYFWGDMVSKLPVDCRWVVHEVGVLTHPTSGVIFGYVFGTSAIMLRLPETTREAAFAGPGYGKQYDYRGGSFSAAEVGPDWALVKPFEEPQNSEWCLRAYEYAGTVHHEIG